MTRDEMKAVTEQIKYLNYQFDVIEKNGVCFLQASYHESDVDTGNPELQTTRKWFLSSHATKSEIVQTALKCVLTSAEHRVRENFYYNNSRVFGPHFDVDELKALADRKAESHRPDPAIA